jgi:hypothetical protein
MVSWAAGASNRKGVEDASRGIPKAVKTVSVKRKMDPQISQIFTD